MAGNGPGGDLEKAIEANRRAQAAAATFRQELARTRRALLLEADSMAEEIAACRRAMAPVTGRGLTGPNYAQQPANVGWPPFRGANQPYFKEKSSEPEPHPDVLDRRGSRTYRLMHQLQAWRKDELVQLCAGVRQATQETLLSRGITALERVAAGADPGQAATNMLAGVPAVMAQYLPSAPVADRDSLRAWSTAIQEVPQHVLESAAELVDWSQVASRFVLTRSAEECRLRWVNLESPQITRARWGRAERDKLCAVAARHQGRNWEAVAAELGSGRTAWQCFCEYARLQDAERRVLWSPEEDERLRELVERFGAENWTQVAVFLGKDASPVQCSMRWAKLGAERRMGPWTTWEDRRLLLAHQACGDSWTEVSSFLPGRTHAQCRERYTFVLSRQQRPQRQTGDAERLMALIDTHGLDWSAIAQGMGRTAKGCRRLMHSLIKRKPAGRRLKDDAGFVRAVFAAQQGLPAPTAPAPAPAPPSAGDQAAVESPPPESDSSPARPPRKRSRRVAVKAQPDTAAPTQQQARAAARAPAPPQRLVPLALVESFAEEALRLPAPGPSSRLTLRSCNRAGIQDRRLWRLLLRSGDYVDSTVRRRVRALFDSRVAAEEAVRAVEEAGGADGGGVSATGATDAPTSDPVIPVPAAARHLGESAVSAARYLHGKVAEQLLHLAERRGPRAGDNAALPAGQGGGREQGEEGAVAVRGQASADVEAHLSLQARLRQRVWAHTGPRVTGTRYLTPKAEAEALSGSASAATAGQAQEQGAPAAAAAAAAAAATSDDGATQAGAGAEGGALAAHGAVSHAVVEEVVREMNFLDGLLRRAEAVEQGAVGGFGGDGGRQRLASAAQAILDAVREECELVAVLVAVVAALDTESEPIASELARHLVAMWVVVV